MRKADVTATNPNKKIKGVFNFRLDNRIKAIATTNAASSVLPFEKIRISKKIKKPANQATFFRLLLSKNFKKVIKLITPAYLAKPVALVPTMPNICVAARMFPKFSYGLALQNKKFIVREEMFPGLIKKNKSIKTAKKAAIIQLRLHINFIFFNAFFSKETNQSVVTTDPYINAQYKAVFGSFERIEDITPTITYKDNSPNGVTKNSLRNLYFFTNNKVTAKRPAIAGKNDLSD